MGLLIPKYQHLSYVHIARFSASLSRLAIPSPFTLLPGVVHTPPKRHNRGAVFLVPLSHAPDGPVTRIPCHAARIAGISGQTPRCDPARARARSFPPPPRRRRAPPPNAIPFPRDERRGIRAGCTRRTRRPRWARVSDGAGAVRPARSGVPAGDDGLAISFGATTTRSGE